MKAIALTLPKRGLPTVAEYLDSQLAICGKSQVEVAQEINYPRPNIITMFKKGITKVPIPTSPKLAKAMGVDEVRFLRICLNEYMPDVLECIETHMTGLLSVNEQEIIKVIREAAEGQDPKMRNAAHMAAFAQATRDLLV